MKPSKEIDSDFMLLSILLCLFFLEMEIRDIFVCIEKCTLQKNTDFSDVALNVLGSHI